MANFSQKINQKIILDMVASVRSAYKTHMRTTGRPLIPCDRNALEHMITDIVKTRFGDHPLCTAYECLVRDGVIAEIKAEYEQERQREVRNELLAKHDPMLRHMIADARVHERRMGYPEMERRDLEAEHMDTGPSQELLRRIGRK